MSQSLLSWTTPYLQANIMFVLHWAYLCHCHKRCVVLNVIKALAYHVMSLKDIFTQAATPYLQQWSPPFSLFSCVCLSFCLPLLCSILACNENISKTKEIHKYHSLKVNLRLRWKSNEVFKISFPQLCPTLSLWATSIFFIHFIWFSRN